MTPLQFAIDVLRRRTATLEIEISVEVLDRLAIYVELLTRWNSKINLTSLPLTPFSDEACDRLLIEPLIAVREAPQLSGRWFDLGSGGGSPALPMKAAMPSLPLTMVESRGKKATFLREASGAMGFSDVHIENARFEEIAATHPTSASFVTVRAVRIDDGFVETAKALLKNDGLLMLFRPKGTESVLNGFELVASRTLIAERASELMSYRRVFHVEHSR